MELLNRQLNFLLLKQAAHNMFLWLYPDMNGFGFFFEQPQ